MRAVQFSAYGPPSVVHVAEAEEPHAGPGEVRIAARASGLSTGETRIRSGALRDVIPVEFPFRTGFDAAGLVDEIGPGVRGVRPGDPVFGWTAGRGANADLVTLSVWAPKPPAWTWAEAGGAAGSIESATRVLDLLGVDAGQTVLIHGAAGGVGTVAVQLAAARGATVIGTASEHNHDLLGTLGALPVRYGPGLRERLGAHRIDAVVDCAGGSLPELIEIAGAPARVVTIADLGAAAHGVHLSHGGADPLAAHSLTDPAVPGLRIPVAAEFPLAEAAAAHALSESRRAADAGQRRTGPGRIVLLT